MKTNMTLIVAVGLAISSCSNGRDSDSNGINGAYAREYSFKVVNPETGSEIGMRTIRDTIFIRPVESGYEVSNSKWSLNDYDKDGWQSMEHDEDYSMPTFQATFNSVDGSLESGSMPHLFLDLERRQLYKDKGREKPYQKIR
jgi:hypothetical protein